MILRRGIIALFAFLAASGSATAQSPVERGSYLVNSVMACGNCHTPKGPDGVPQSDKELSGGGLSFDTPAFVATASNITPDRETGIGTWTDADIKRLLKEEIRPTGVPVAGIMAVDYYKALTPSDLDAVVAYLRSIKPIRNEVPLPSYKLPVRHDSVPDAGRAFSDETLQDVATRGRYLATIGHCMECHTAQVRGIPDFESGYGKGGRQFSPAAVKGLPSTWAGATARNITSHPTTGLGAWSDAEIKRAITQGISRDGRKLQPPMAFAWYSWINDADLNAIVAYLRTVPPKE